MGLTSPKDLAALAESIARDTGALLLAHARSAATGVASKSSPTDLVSDADRAADALVTGRLRAAYPDDAIVSEESAPVEGLSGRTWYVDPLDGTINYLYRMPH